MFNRDFSGLRMEQFNDIIKTKSYEYYRDYITISQTSFSVKYWILFFRDQMGIL